MLSKTPSLDITMTFNLLISKNVSEFLQVKRQDSLKAKQLVSIYSEVNRHLSSWAHFHLIKINRQRL